MHVLISGLSILSHGSMCLSFVPIPYYLDYSRFVVYFEIREGFPGGSDGEESACNAGDQGSIPGSGRFPWRREWLPTLVILPGKSHGQRSLVGYSPRGHKET